MTETHFMLSCGKRRKKRTWFNPCCPGTQNLQAGGPLLLETCLQLPSLPSGSWEHLPHLEILRELTSLDPLVRGDVGLFLPNNICFPEGRKATLKPYQNKSYKRNTRLYRNQSLVLYAVHVYSSHQNHEAYSKYTAVTRPWAYTYFTNTCKHSDEVVA